MQKDCNYNSILLFHFRRDSRQKLDLSCGREDAELFICEFVN